MMVKKLLIVESPAKVKTLRAFLGAEFIAAASLGHIRDLPERELGIEPDSLRPHYVLLSGKQDVVKRLKGLLKGAAALYLATDPDREGEAIAWHLVEVLKPRCPVYRVTFNTLTEAAVKAALQNPRGIDMALVNAQQARRLVDRLVGYGVSPLLWGRFDDESAGENLSAGRVQTVGLRLVVEREAAISAFQPQTYWTLDADFEARGGRFTARLTHWQGADVTLKHEDAVREIIHTLRDSPFHIQQIQQRQRPRQPAPPFTTSALQQAASVLLDFSPEQTMRLAQMLYEGLELDGQHIGLITYMRTDAVAVAPEAQAAAARRIQADYGPDYLPANPPTYKARDSAQEAHEAIRPTDPTRTPAQLKPHLEGDLYQLYDLIWRRFLASQMSHARFAETTVTVQADSGAAQFRTAGRTLLFDGFLRVYAHDEAAADKTDDGLDAMPQAALPELRENEGLLLTAWNPVERFTRPPGRYSEAALVQALEKHGVGRPSTYASTLATLRTRGYITVGAGRKLFPTSSGRLICQFLVSQFPDLFAYDFTAQLERELDAVASGQADADAIVRRLWLLLAPQLQQTGVPSHPKHKPASRRRKSS